jgi:peptidoglycan/LPS O-acetylase OafA/YrhL
LTGLRWVAAFAVFWFHVAGWGAVVSGWWRLPQFGFIGVAFFFVLSGMVLTWSARPGQSARQFAWRRFARIYPAHAVMTIVAIALYVFVMPPYKPVWAGLLALLLLHAWPPIPIVNSAANGVSWSLSCEAFFYAVFPKLTSGLANRTQRQRAVVVAGVLGVCSAVAVAGSFAFQGRYDTPLYENPLVRVGEFVLGVALGLALRDGWIPRLRVRTGWLLVLAAVGVSLLVGWQRGWPVPRGFADVIAVGPLAAVLVAYAGCDLIGRRTVMATRWAVYLGQISFAFYLVHQLMLDLVMKQIWPMQERTGVAVLERVPLALTLSVVAAMAVHHGIELPGQRWLTRRSKRRTTATVLPYPERDEAERPLVGAAS